MTAGSLGYKTTDQALLLSAIAVTSSIGVGIWFLQLFLLAYHIPAIRLYPSFVVVDKQRLSYNAGASWKKQKTFLKQFKNPCWYEESEGKVSCLPYFHLFGACKSGTTDLFYRITQHPHILKNKGIMGKETWFWSWRRYGNGNMPGGTMYLSQFTKLFDSESISRDKMLRSDGSPYHHLITGHGEPMDLWDQSYWKLIPQNDPEGKEPNITTPFLIKYVNPSIKLILILRNPVERLYSHYLHGNYGNNTDQFHMDVLQTIRDLQACQKNRTLRSCLYDQDHKEKFKVPISASLYHVHLQEWLKVFSRHQLHIIRSEDYRANISRTLQDVFSFLNVDNADNVFMQ
ncbi:carbohydrate sulfotransferase 15-like [Pecten maximus]|uniref:carbohydrate sulfotransferase 15-like n=1 Tax=Pecten maximus TaxID=6579 RepID=UPI0014581161|nr:carbohydrate sulfotransferase 15-like [Pecten maximus]